MADIFSLIMDVFILLLLGATVFYAARLSLQLKVFRQSRKEMAALMKDLADHIDHAEEAITGLREAARESGRDLQEQISEAGALKDELALMVQSGSNLAGRLEQAAEKSSSRNQHERYAEPEEHFEAEPSKTQNASNSPFMIRDLDHERDDEEAYADNENWNDDGMSEFQSRAEKELYDALKTQKKIETAGEV